MFVFFCSDKAPKDKQIHEVTQKQRSRWDCVRWFRVWVTLDSRRPLAETLVLQGVAGGLHYFHISNSSWALQECWASVSYQPDPRPAAGLSLFPQIWPKTAPGLERGRTDGLHRIVRYGFHARESTKGQKHGPSRGKPFLTMAGICARGARMFGCVSLKSQNHWS